MHKACDKIPLTKGNHIFRDSSRKGWVEIFAEYRPWSQTSKFMIPEECSSL